MPTPLPPNGLTQRKEIWSQWLGNWMWIKDGLHVKTQSVNRAMSLKKKKRHPFRVWTFFCLSAQASLWPQRRNRTWVTGHNMNECEWVREFHMATCFVSILFRSRIHMNRDCVMHHQNVNIAGKHEHDKWTYKRYFFFLCVFSIKYRDWPYGLVHVRQVLTFQV